MENQMILEKLNRLERLIIDSTKEIFNVDDLVNYTGFTRSHIYKLVHKNVIPYSKPNGKFLFFLKSEIDEWLLQNKSQSVSQIEQQALDYSLKNRKK